MQRTSRAAGPPWAASFAFAIALASQAYGQSSKESTVLDTQLVSWQKFSSRSEGRWRAQWNEVTGTPRRISGHYLELPAAPTRANIEALTRTVLARHREMLGANPAALALKRADHDEPARKGDPGTWYVTYGQVHQGVPVFGGSARLLIQGRRVTMFGADFYRGITLSTRPVVSADIAEAEASRHLGGQRGLRALSKERVVYPRSQGGRLSYHLAWMLTMPISQEVIPRRAPAEGLPQKRDAPGSVVQWRYFVDAHSGEFIDRFNVFLHQAGSLTGHVTGLVHQEGSSPGSFLPIRNLDIRLIQRPRGGRGDDSPTRGGWPTFADLLTHLGSRCPARARTNSSGDYVFANTFGCRNPLLVSRLQGPFAEIVDMGSPPRATIHVSESPGSTHHWNWDADDQSPADVQTSTFYHVNWIHDWFKRRTPFDIEPSLKPLPVHVRVPWPSLACNAGSGAPGLYFSPAGDGCTDMALCASIVYHEYTHSVVEEIYAPIGGLAARGHHAIAVHEAIADYFAQSIVDHPYVSRGCKGGAAGTRNLDTPERRYPQGLSSDPHAEGLILSGALWDVRAVLGKDFVDGLVFRALKQLPLTFSEFLEALVLEDDLAGYQPGADSNVSNGSPNIRLICDKFFAVHGVYHAVCAGHTATPLAVIRDPSPVNGPAIFQRSPNSIAVAGAAAGSIASPFASFAVEYAEQTSGPWQSAGMSLVGGGQSPVADGALANWDISSVPDGVYKLRLRVTDARGSIAFSTVDVAIDPWLRPGWPHESALHAGPAAVGDLAYWWPGAEIVAVRCAVMFFLAEGTLYHWFYLPGTQCSTSAPAIGDLDGDGFPDVVVSADVLAAYRNDGSGWFTPFFDPPLQIGTGVLSASPVLADLDGDGDLEIVMAAQNGNLHILHHDGTPFSHGGFTWPKAAPAIFGTPVVADVDRDGRLDILAGAEDGRFYAWRLDGTDLPGWPVNVGMRIRSSAAVGNIDGDAAGTLEVVVGAQNGRVYAWSANGAALPGWPVTVAAGRPVNAAPALGDLDADGRLEIVVHGDNGPLEVFRHDATPFPGWTSPPEIFTGHAAVIADLDGDARPEILIGPRQGKVHAFRPSGAAFPGFPRRTFTTLSNEDTRSPLIANIDASAQQELIVGGYIWNLPSTGSPAGQHWPAFHRDMRRSGRY